MAVMRNQRGANKQREDRKVRIQGIVNYKKRCVYVRLIKIKPLNLKVIRYKTLHEVGLSLQQNRDTCGNKVSHPYVILSAVRGLFKLDIADRLVEGNNTRTLTLS